MNKCIICENLKREGNKYSCPYCPGKVCYGAPLDPLREYCDQVRLTKKEKDRRGEKGRKLRSLMQRESEHDIKYTRGGKNWKGLKFTSAGK